MGLFVGLITIVFFIFFVIYIDKIMYLIFIFFVIYILKKIIQRQAEKQRQEYKKREAEKREAKEREAEKQRQEYKKLEYEKREAEKREAEKQRQEYEKQRQEYEKQRQEYEKQRQEYEKREAEKRKAEKREAEKQRQEYKKLEDEVLNDLGFSSWQSIPYYDEDVVVKSRQALEKYDIVDFFKSNKEQISKVENIIQRRIRISLKLKSFLANNKYMTSPYYNQIVIKVNKLLERTPVYRVNIKYISSAGNFLAQKEISIDKKAIDKFKNDPSLLMGKGEYNQYIKEQQKEALNQKQHTYYEKVNAIINIANKSRDNLVVSESQESLDKLIMQLFDRTVNSIKKVKTIDSEEWSIIGDFLNHINEEVNKITSLNQRILDYYASPEFFKIKSTCDTLMSSQKEFNDYINEKISHICKLFGIRVVREETVNNDKYNYIHQYKKTVTPFTVEVSAAVFASAENEPLKYVIKSFYPDKNLYPEQIQKLHQFVEELETLRDAKQIIENNKEEYRQYIGDVPDFVLENDEAGFFSKLGFANIDESVLTVEYKFVYTSGGGMTQRYFTVPMTESTIISLINMLESKLTIKSFAKEQRAIMTQKLRDYIKTRDCFTCCNCGNSTNKEPNLLLEIDHIIPVSKGGCTVESNLQTLCWVCNRKKSDKIMY